MTYVTPVSNEENCHNMGYTFGPSAVVEGLEVFALPDDVELLFGNIHVCQDIVPFVLFANEEFVLGSHGNPSTLANETNEGDLAP